MSHNTHSQATNKQQAQAQQSHQQKSPSCRYVVVVVAVAAFSALSSALLLLLRYCRFAGSRRSPPHKNNTRCSSRCGSHFLIRELVVLRECCTGCSGRSGRIMSTTTTNFPHGCSSTHSDLLNNCLLFLHAVLPFHSIPSRPKNSNVAFYISFQTQYTNTRFLSRP